MADWQNIAHLLLSTGKSASILLLGIMWGRRTRFGVVFWPIVGYLISDSAIYILDFFVKRVFHNNNFIFHLSTFSDVTWLTLLFIHLASGNTKNWLKLGWLLFFVSAIVSALWVDELTTNMNTLSRVAGNGFLIFMAFRQLSQMVRREYLLPPAESPAFILCVMVAIYYSSSLPVFIGQDLARYGLFEDSGIDVGTGDFMSLIISFYPFLRAIQFGLLLHLLLLFPMGITPRRALPRWLRFRLGWRPPSSTWRYRVLPPHLAR